MKRFAFNLEKVLSLRKYREQETEIQLGRAIGVLSEIENNIHFVTEERIRSGAQFAENNATVHSYLLYANRLDIQKEQLIKDSVIAEQKVDEARSVYIEASRDRKVLDNLRDKREAEYKKFVLSEETKVLDDQAAGRQRANRNTGRDT
jgi:flagellar FliJ protein